MARITPASPVDLAREYQSEWNLWRSFWILLLVVGVVTTAISAAYVTGAVRADAEWPVRWTVIGVVAVVVILLNAPRRRAHAGERAIRTVERALVPFLMTGASMAGAPEAISRAIVEGLNQLDRY